MTAAYRRATLRELFGLTTHTRATPEKAVADITTLVTQLGGPMLSGDHLNYTYSTRQR
ncbi:MAG TPA: hypothetical protein VNM91_03455 [Dehalococcoidia bacterium]|nr:hypothetical protein [Dehalococcoidia bacterium]